MSHDDDGLESLIRHPPTGALMGYGAARRHVCIYLGHDVADGSGIVYHVLWPLDESERAYNMSIYGKPWHLTRYIEDYWEIIATVDMETP